MLFIIVIFFSFMAACLCSDLIDEQLDPLPTCSDNINGGTITDAISNGGATYTSLAINSGRATYQCDEGYSISGDNARECQGDGSWSGTVPINLSRRRRYRDMYKERLHFIVFESCCNIILCYSECH